MEKYLFDHLKEITDRVKNAPHVLLLLDYDGTIVPIAQKPSLARLSPEGKKLLENFFRNSRISVGIITGRSLKEIRRLVSIEGLFYAGNHGFEILFRGEIWVHPEAERLRPILKSVARELKRELSSVEGVLMEDKGLSVAIHYRQVTEKSPRELRRLISQVIRPYRGILRIATNKKVYEVRPDIDWDKGKAVRKISEMLAIPSLLRVYIGDDRTDEDAFRVLEGEDISILVGTRKHSGAGYFCRSSGQVLSFLKYLGSVFNGISLSA